MIGVDPAGQMVSQADRLCPKATFKVASAESLPLPDESADIVLSSISFHHWADQERGLQEIARVLRPEGLFCLADHTFRLAGLFGGKVRSRDQIRGLLMGAGLAVRRYRRLRVRCVLSPWLKKDRPVFHNSFETIRQVLDKWAGFRLSSGTAEPSSLFLCAALAGGFVTSFFLKSSTCATR